MSSFKFLPSSGDFGKGTTGLLHPLPVSLSSGEGLQLASHHHII